MIPCYTNWRNLRYPYFIPLTDSEGTEVTVGDHRLIMIGSNNYLGLTTRPRVRQAAIEATQRYGTSCTGSRFLNGTLELHLELERRLAEFVGTGVAVGAAAHQLHSDTHRRATRPRAGDFRTGGPGAGAHRLAGARRRP